MLALPLLRCLLCGCIALNNYCNEATSIRSFMSGRRTFHQIFAVTSHIGKHYRHRGHEMKSIHIDSTQLCFDPSLLMRLSREVLELILGNSIYRLALNDAQ